MKQNLDAEELEILEMFERGEFKSVPNLEQEIEWAREAARRTIKRTIVRNKPSDRGKLIESREQEMD